jgi:peptidoglycan/xylan/chitin deacetylase (PgdA/CDA1 family)
VTQAVPPARTGAFLRKSLNDKRNEQAGETACATWAWATAGSLLSSAAIMAYAVRGRASSLLAPSVYKGAGDRRAIALTFDDGPSESTPALLEILDKYRAPATFFQCGANVRRLPHIARQVALAGHEIGNHSDSHLRFQFKSSAFIYDEIAIAQASIVDITGVRPRLFRAPFGVRWFGLREAQSRLNLLGVMWTALGVDWKLPGERVAFRLLRRAANGAIFCLHDGRELAPRPDISSTLGAVRTLLPLLIDRGFHFEKVTDILCPTT